MELTKEIIKEKMATDRLWLVKCILAIYKRQTTSEQHSQSSLEKNNVGFNSRDAGILSSFAEQIQNKFRRKVELINCLTEKQLAVAHRLMPKYS